MFELLLTDRKIIKPKDIDICLNTDNTNKKTVDLWFNNLIKYLNDLFH